MDRQSDFIKNLSKKYDLPEIVVRTVVRSQYGYVKSCIEKKEPEGVLLHSFGTFRIKRGRINGLLKGYIKGLRKKLGKDLTLIKKIKYLWSMRNKVY
tara:strand:- start:499 stop:789 length:291 start_codon:yes stop_codon:yes gene_type:complete